MRLVLIHGIGQQATNEEALKHEWLEVIRRALSATADWPGDPVTVKVPFYGDKLDALARGLANSATALAQGVDGEADDFAAFARKDLYAMARRIGVTDAEIAAEANLQAIPQSMVDKAWIKAIARVLERVSPLRGRLALMLIKQAHSYIARPHIASEIDAIVRPALNYEGPMIVVSHSLGTVVSYKLLREFAAQQKPRNVPLFVTLGSPLSMDAVRRGFPVPRLRPDKIARWLNVADPNDFVALSNVLDSNTFWPGPIENINIDNGDDPHASLRYLRDPLVVQAISLALKQNGGTTE